jgi:hypothetical protein
MIRNEGATAPEQASHPMNTRTQARRKPQGRSGEFGANRAVTKTKAVRKRARPRLGNRCCVACMKNSLTHTLPNEMNVDTHSRTRNHTLIQTPSHPPPNKNKNLGNAHTPDPAWPLPPPISTRLTILVPQHHTRYLPALFDSNYRSPCRASYTVRMGTTCMHRIALHRYTHVQAYRMLATRFGEK